MPSKIGNNNAKKGTYYKARTKKWLEGKGYVVGSLEKMFPIMRPGKTAFFIKQDQFGSDLLAVGSSDLIFVQVKLNRKNIAVAHKEFAKFPWPSSKAVKRWIVVWEVGGHEPEIIVAK